MHKKSIDFSQFIDEIVSSCLGPDGHRRITLRRGRNFLAIDPDNIFETAPE